MTDTSDPQQTRPKQRRHRTRASCINCANRRQKCDRAHPCGLCVERGCQDTCEYLDVPYARPPPGRGSGSAESMQSQGLRTRIAELEREVAALTAQVTALQQRLAAHASPRWSSSSQTPAASDFASPVFAVGPAPLGEEAHGKRSEEPTPPAHMKPFEDSVYSCSFIYAQRSLGHVGEFIGRGSILCALHAVSSKSTARMLYADSTKSIECPIDHHGVHVLLDALPSRDVLDQLLEYYFGYINCQFGIPESWFRDTHVAVQNERASHLKQAVNPNWLALLYALLASIPPTAPCFASLRPYWHDTRRHYDHAHESCRLASAAYLEPVPLDQSLGASAADGAVVRCFAISLMCVYLAEHGHVSEAWKLAGSAIRLAISVGMHRDPSWALWQEMSVDESTLRRRSWWNLVILDRLYSYVLGRPPMVRGDLADVKLPDDLPGGPSDAYETRAGGLLRLCLIMGDAMEKCFSPSLVPGPAVYELDEKFKEWGARLARVADPDTRHTLAFWFYAARMKLHHAFVTRGLPPQPGALAERARTYSVAESRAQCLQSASHLIDCYCDRQGPDAPAPESVFLLYEATVTMISMMNQTPVAQRLQKHEQVVGRAYALFQNLAGRPNQESSTPHLALRTLEKLVEDDCWRAPTTSMSGPGQASAQGTLNRGPTMAIPHGRLAAPTTYAERPAVDTGLSMPPPPLLPPLLGLPPFESAPSTSHTAPILGRASSIRRSLPSIPTSPPSIAPLSHAPPPPSFCSPPSSVPSSSTAPLREDDAALPSGASRSYPRR
ncbi:fungal-specific transcription factor domain-containing protein [Schizophyllum fasciatum]